MAKPPNLDDPQDQPPRSAALSASCYSRAQPHGRPWGLVGLPQLQRKLSVILLFDVLCFPLFDGPIGEFGKSAPDATQHAVVLAAVKDAARR